MKFVKTLTSVLLLFSIIYIISISPSAFAEVTIVPVAGSSIPGCEDLDGCYSPDPVRVNVGEVVIFSNTDVKAHTFTSGTPASDTVGEIFNTGLLKVGDSFPYTTDTVGEFPYFCMIHPWMQGLIIVQEAGAQVVEETTPEVVEETIPEVVEETTTPEVVEETTTPEVVEEMMETESTDEAEGGGCLIATAAYGTELAPQVQFLREIRDNTVMSTASGAAFMTGFNQFYYSFSPTIADMERDNPMFQEIVRAFITPMVSTLSIMTLAEDGNESQVLGLGISVIVLNLGMYIAAPALIGFKVHNHFKYRK
jgi:plastocyanin